MPAPATPVARGLSSSTRATYYEATLRRNITSLISANPSDPRRELQQLLTTVIPQTDTTAVSRAMRDEIHAVVTSRIDNDPSLYKVALAALDLFVSVRINGARLKASAFFDQLVTEHDWKHLALLAGSSVAEASFLAVNARSKRVTIIDRAPQFDGRGMAKRLAAATGAQVRYGLLSNCQKLLDGVDALVMGAEEVTMNGCVLAASGSGAIIQIAREMSVPVVITTQTVKFSDNMIVDWAVGDWDVIRPEEIMFIVTEMDTGTRTGSWCPASAPDVLRRLTGV